MPFSSQVFVHGFLPAFLLAYACAPRAARNYVALVGSIAFYAWGAPRFVPVVLALGLVDFAVARRLAGAGRRRRALLAAGITVHLSILAYFKYANFFVGELDRIAACFGYELAWTHVALPIGISFITFEEISYLCDVYRGDAVPARRWSSYLLFLTLFPHAIAGPIFRWKDLAAQLEARVHGWELVREGLERFAVGLAKKVLVADTVGVIADAAFADPAPTFGFAWLGAGAYALQIYFDFSGYSDMAIGLGRILGFRFKENFDRPYVAASVTEFWTRWHISLSTWLRDYLYIPLGGNRRGAARTSVNVVIVFALSGLWHGAAWTFVAWGLAHGLVVAGERALGARRERIPRALQHALTLAFVVAAWVPFRAGSLADAGTLLAAMVGLGATPAATPVPAIATPLHAQVALVVAAAIALAPIAARYGVKVPRLPSTLARVAHLAVFAAALVHLANAKFTPLIYFKF